VENLVGLCFIRFFICRIYLGLYSLSFHSIAPRNRVLEEKVLSRTREVKQQADELSTVSTDQPGPGQSGRIK
jgi:hypothetical protein